MRHKLLICSLVVVFIWGCGGGELTRSKLAKMQREPLPSFTPPAVQVVDLTNGAKLFLLEDHGLPIVNIEVAVRAGSIYEGNDRLGVASLMAMTLLSGGARERKPDEVDELIDDTAARISFSAGYEMFEGFLKTLTPKLDETLPLFFDMLFKPQFDQKRFIIDKLNLVDQLKRDEDDPELVASRDFKKLVYGSESPWARTPTPPEVATLKREEIIAFWKQFIRPNNILIAAAGDFTAADLIKRIEEAMQGAANEAVKLPTVAAVKLEFNPGDRLVRRNLTQSFIYVGHLGIKRHDPDKYALQVMNTILGGGSFKSRLMEDIRTNRGLAYSVWSHYGWGTDYGLFRIYAATKAGQAAEVISLIKADVRRLADTGEVSRREFGYAKDAELNRLIFEFDDSFKIATSRAYYHFFGYPPNYWEVYRDAVKALKRSDVERVARKYLHPDGLKVLVVGP